MFLLPLLLVACSIQGGPGDLVGTTRIWYRPFGGKEIDQGWGIDVVDDGGLVLANTESHPDSIPDAWVHRIQSDGDVAWSSSYATIGEDRSTGVRVVGDQVLVGGASFTALTPDSSDALLASFDLESGDELWSFTVDGGHGYDAVEGLAATSDALYASGWTQQNELDMDVLLLKVGLDGELQWQTHWGELDWDEANGPMAADDACLYVAGRFGGINYDGVVTGGQGNLACFDPSSGELSWNVLFLEEGYTSEDPLGLLLTADALYTVGYAIDPDPGEYHLIVRAFDLAGTPLWSSLWAGAGNTLGRSLVQDPLDGSLIVAATTDGLGEPNGDMLFIRVAPDGTMGDAVTWGGAGSDEAHDLVMVDERACANGSTDSVGKGRGDAVALCFEPDGWHLPTLEE